MWPRTDSRALVEVHLVVPFDRRFKIGAEAACQQGHAGDDADEDTQPHQAIRIDRGLGAGRLPAHRHDARRVGLNVDYADGISVALAKAGVNVALCDINDAGIARTLDAIKVSARVAAELGADWVKIPYVEGFAEVVQTCYVPVVVLGGKKKDDVRTTLNMLHTSLGAGGVGGVIGRNIWQSGRTEAMTRTMADIIHRGIGVDEALVN